MWKRLVKWNASMFFLCFVCFILFDSKVRLTDKQLVNQLLSAWFETNDLVDWLDMSMNLMKSYWKILYSGEVLDGIKGISSSTYLCLLILKITNKRDVTTIRNLISFVKKLSKNYADGFVVKANTSQHYEKVKKYLDTEFDWSHVEKYTTKWNSIRVSGEWRYYKRWLEQDVMKLLEL